MYAVPQLAEAVIFDRNSKEHPQNEVNQKELPHLKKHFTKSKEFQGRSHLIYCQANTKPIENISFNNFISRSIQVNEFVMVELSEVFQQPKFQSLCHDLLFHCRFLFVFLFVIFQTNCDINYLQFFYVLQHGRCFMFMFYCMTQWQKFSVFWQQAGHGGIYIVLIDTTNQVRQLYIFQC